MILKLRYFLNYLFGFVEVKIEGYFAERLVNQAKLKKMVIWNIKRDKTIIIYANVKYEDFNELSKMAKDNECEISVIKEVGFPYIFRRYRKRKIFLISIIFVIITLFTISRFIWNIQIEGLEKISEEELINDLNVNGLKTGMLKRNINTNEVINKIRLHRKDISWIGIELMRYKCSCKNTRSRRKARNYRR